MGVNPIVGTGAGAQLDSRQRDHWVGVQRAVGVARKQ
jgi:hypothetical protein